MFQSHYKKDIDLLAAYKRKQKPSSLAPIVRIALLPLCLILLFTAVFTFYSLRISTINNDIDATDKKIESYQKKIKNTGSEAYDLYSYMKSQNNDITALINNIHSYPRMSTDVMMIFINNLLNGLSNKSIVYENGTITMNASATNVLTIENYVRKLRESGLFSMVDYKGYQSSETSKTITSNENEVDDITLTTEEYVFQVTCVMKGVD